MATEERGEYVAARPILLEKASLGIGESRRAEREDWARGPAGLARFSVLQLYIGHHLAHH
jgi:hypothetical protein